jgi:phosphatidylinositol alpha 1,6-mannosyltransferase
VTVEIAFFSDSYLPIRDGVAMEVHALARALRRHGHGVTVFSPDPVVGARPHDEEIDGVQVVRCRSLPVPQYDQYRWALFPFGMVAGRSFGSRMDVVHVHTPGLVGTTGFFAARRWHRPLIGTFHTDVYAARESFGARRLVQLFFWGARFYSLGLYYRCDVATAPSGPARNSLLIHARKPFRRSVEVVPNGIETDRFRPGIAVPDWRMRCGFDSEPLLTYLGRLTVDKGVHRFLDALEALPAEARFNAAIAGVGPEEGAVRRWIATRPRLKDRVRYLGPITESEKPALLAQSDVYVLPSISDTSSIAVLEAMASGVPCVVSNVGGPSAIVEDGRTGRVVPVDSPGPLAQALEELLAEPGNRRRLGRTARAWAQAEASIDVTARRFISLYELLLTERRGSSAAGQA